MNGIQLKTFQQFFSAAPSKRVKLCNKREIRGKTQRIVLLGLKVAVNLFIYLHKAGQNSQTNCVYQHYAEYTL